jgi:alanyl-tRNA synthetase
MPDEQNVGAGSVNPQSESVTPSPDTQGSNEELQRLQAKLALVQQDKAKAGETNAQLNARLKESEEKLQKLSEQLQSGKQQKLAESGEFKTLWEDAKQTIQQKDQEIATLQQQIESVTQSAREERLRSEALNVISRNGAVSPKQLLGLLSQQLRDKDGAPVILSGGAEVPLVDYVQNLKHSDSGWAHHFAPSGGRGMGSSPTSLVSPGVENPYRSGNLTEMLRMEVENPELAQALKAEARKG